MDKMNFGKKLLCELLVLSFALSACTPTDVPSSRTNANAIGTGNTAGTGNGSVSTTGGVGSGTTLPPKVEVRHLIEPNLSTDPNYSPGTGYAGGGSYVRKLTLPKNYAGRLYVAGINIGTLSSTFVKVRFRFGVSREPVEIPATVTQAPGITPQTGIHVLVLDLRSEPFRNIRLYYDLFDYNEYPRTASGTLASTAEPVQDNRDTNLYCRGLRVEDDPTFEGVGACDGTPSSTSQPEEECLYAYAKVLDQGLVKDSNGVMVPLSPSLPQVKIATTGSTYYHDSMSNQILKPLTDTVPTDGSYEFSKLALPLGSTNAILATFAAWAGIVFPDSYTYYYRGPYRLVNTNEWQFQFARPDGKNRLFRSNAFIPYPLRATSPLPDDTGITYTPHRYYYDRIYYNSYLFPLATKIDVAANVTHLSHANPGASRTPTTYAVPQKSLWMDGANARAQSRNHDQEHVGSCNVSSTIEVVAKDANGNDYVVALAKDVKLQLVRPTTYHTEYNNDVLYSNFKTCTSSATCGGNECCYNNRCWDKNLVSQCKEDSAVQGNRIVGDSCTSDFQCQTLCCNTTSGTCANHNALAVPAVLCSKPVGEFCIAKEWCGKSPVTKCLVIKTGTDASGNVTCRQQCYTTQEFGDCLNGTCIPPEQPAIPSFDPDAEGACDGAVTAPSF